MMLVAEEVAVRDPEIRRNGPGERRVRGKPLRSAKQTLDVTLGLLLAPVIPRVVVDFVKPQGGGLLDADAGHGLSRGCAG